MLRRFAAAFGNPDDEHEGGNRTTEEEAGWGYLPCSASAARIALYTLTRVCALFLREDKFVSDIFWEPHVPVVAAPVGAGVGELLYHDILCIPCLVFSLSLSPSLHVCLAFYVAENLYLSLPTLSHFVVPFWVSLVSLSNTSIHRLSWYRFGRLFIWFGRTSSKRS